MVGTLVTGGVHLLLQRSMVRLVFGLSLLGHAANLVLLASGVGRWRGEAFVGYGDRAQMADPLPQAFVLTAIVITFATTTVMLTLAVIGHNDDTVQVVSVGEEHD